KRLAASTQRRSGGPTPALNIPGGVSAEDIASHNFIRGLFGFISPQLFARCEQCLPGLLKQGRIAVDADKERPGAISGAISQKTRRSNPPSAKRRGEDDQAHAVGSASRGA